MRYLGIDYGTKKVGLALSDEAGTMGFPNSIVANTRVLADTLVALISRESVGGIVIGESRNLSGEDNPIVPAAHALGDEIALRTGLPVMYESELYTTAEARRQHTKENKSRATKEEPDVDDSAAALILTSYLTRIRA